jgi:hypothetical protein
VVRRPKRGPLTKTITIAALAGLLVVGAAAASMLGRDDVPAAASAAALPVIEGAVPNRESKQDRLAVADVAQAPFEISQPPVLREPPRQAIAFAAPVEIEAPKVAAPVFTPLAPLASEKPKPASKPPQKPYALLSDAQIASIKERLKLSSAQESYWPAVENALRAVAKKIHATRQADPNATGAPIDPDAEEVQQLKSAAMPLLFQLREDQKREVRTLARIIGLEKVASQI